MSTNQKMPLLLAVMGLLLAAAALFFSLYGKTNIAYVNTQQIFEGFNGTTELDGKLKALQNDRKAQLDSLELAINMMAKDGTSPQLQAKQQQWMELNQQFNQETQEQSQTFTDQIWKQINEYATSYGKENGYDFVLGANGSGTIMHADKGKEVTEELIQYINNKYEGN